MLKAIAAFGLGLWVTACSLPPIAAPEFVPKGTEREFWDEAAKIHERLLAANLIVVDPRFDSYATSLAHRVLSQLGAPAITVRLFVLRDPFINAFAMPNGTIYLHAGLLSAVENEAQLAAVLGHELAHFIGRDAARVDLDRSRTQIVAGIAATVFTVATVGYGSPLVWQVMRDDGRGQGIVAAQVAGYSRDLEREADAAAVRIMRALGYDLSQCEEMFAHLRAEAVERGVEEPYLYGRHPSLDERVASCRAAAAEGGSSGGTELGMQRYEAAVRDVLLDSARANLAIGRPQRALAAARRHVGIDDDSAPGWMMVGDAQRQAGDGAEELIAVRDAYARAAQLDSGNGDAWRELGLAERRLGAIASSRVHLLRYLELQPNAADRMVVEGYLSE